MDGQLRRPPIVRSPPVDSLTPAPVGRLTDPSRFHVQPRRLAPNLRLWVDSGQAAQVTPPDLRARAFELVPHHGETVEISGVSADRAQAFLVTGLWKIHPTESMRKTAGHA